MYDVAARLRAGLRAGLQAGGVHVETVEGMHSVPTHRLVCRSAGGFTLERPGRSDAFDRLDDVIAALGQPS
jgi:hypothetical protein